MSIKYIGLDDFVSAVITMYTIAGGREMHNNCRISFRSDPVKGTAMEQLKKFVDWLDKKSDGAVKYVRASLGHFVADKPCIDIGGKYRKGVIQLFNQTNTTMKQWVNVPFLKPGTSDQDIEAMRTEILVNFNPQLLLRTPGVADPLIFIPTRSSNYAKAVVVGRDPTDYDASGQTFDDDGVDGMGGSVD